LEEIAFAEIRRGFAELEHRLQRKDLRARPFGRVFGGRRVEGFADLEDNRFQRKDLRARPHLPGVRWVFGVRSVEGFASLEEIAFGEVRRGFAELEHRLERKDLRARPHLLGVGRVFGVRSVEGFADSEELPSLKSEGDSQRWNIGCRLELGHT
jgi:hypothetical protein